MLLRKSEAPIESFDDFETVKGHRVVMFEEMMIYDKDARSKYKDPFTKQFISEFEAGERMQQIRSWNAVAIIQLTGEWIKGVHFDVSYEDAVERMERYEYIKDRVYTEGDPESQQEMREWWWDLFPVSPRT